MCPRNSDSVSDISGRRVYCILSRITTRSNTPSSVPCERQSAVAPRCSRPHTHTGGGPPDAALRQRYQTSACSAQEPVRHEHAHTLTRTDLQATQLVLQCQCGCRRGNAVAVFNVDLPLHALCAHERKQDSTQQHRWVHCTLTECTVRAVGACFAAAVPAGSRNCTRKSAGRAGKSAVIAAIASRSANGCSTA